MGSGLKLLQPPSMMPVSLAEAKTHLRWDQDYTVDDLYISTLIRVAYREAERVSARQLVAASWRLYLDDFGWERVYLRKPPVQDVLAVNYVDTNGASQLLDSSLYRVLYNRPTCEIEPVYGSIFPVFRIISEAVWIDFTSGFPCTTVAGAITAGTRTVTPVSMLGIKAAETVLDVDDGENWESVIPTAITGTTFTATFAKNHDASTRINSVPIDVRQAMLLIIGHLYENRESSSDREMYQVPQAAEWLLMGNWSGVYV